MLSRAVKQMLRDADYQERKHNEHALSKHEEPDIECSLCMECRHCRAEVAVSPRVVTGDVDATAD